MKILRIIARLNVGGPARHVVWLTEHLNDDEFQSTLIAGTVPPGEKDMAYLADERGIKPLYIPQMSRELSPKDVVSLFKIFREIRRIRPDIIHTHTAKRSEEHTSELQSLAYLVCRLLLEKKKEQKKRHRS